MEISDFVSALASKAPVPGGGGTSALAGALSAALGHMVGNLTSGKKKYAAFQEEIEEAMEASAKLEARFLRLMAEDEEAFEPLSKAYGLPSGTEEEKERKETVMEECLLRASQAPLDIMRACAEEVELLRVFSEKGSSIAISDAGVGASLCAAALKGAALNVFINTGLMKKRETAEKINQEAQELLGKYLPMADSIYASVLGRLEN